MMRPVMRYHGGKFRLAAWLTGFFPDHTTYVEPYGGAAGVLLQKPRAYSEVYNDMDGDVVTVFRVLRDETLCLELQRRLTLTPYAREEFIAAYEPVGVAADDLVETARRVLVRAYMGFAGGGASGYRTGFESSSERRHGRLAHIWAQLPSAIDAFYTRLQGVMIENKPAIDVMRAHDRADTLFYVDPPYRHAVREIRGKNGVYRYEMSDTDHEALLAVLLALDGMVVLSGYDSAMYNDALAGWQRHATRARISAGRGAGIRTECVWLNPACAQRQAQRALFDEAGTGAAR